MTLTREAILAMPAGPEMDALVAERVMGWRRKEWADGNGHHYCLYEPDGPRRAHPRSVNNPCDPYSTDIAAAWEVVEKFRGARDLILNDGTHHLPTYEVQSGLDEHGPWTFCAFEMGDGVDARCARAETAPLAICRAALLTTLERSQS